MADELTTHPVTLHAPAVISKTSRQATTLTGQGPLMRALQIADLIVPNIRNSLYLAGLLLKDIRPETFATLPKGEGGRIVQTNHPAFCYGHLCTYAPNMLGLLGRDPAAAGIPAEYDSLFKAGTECKDDPAGSIYPKMEGIVAAFNRGHEAAMKAVAETPDEVFLKINPAEGRFRELCPTVGAAVSFLGMSHIMLHLGQVSAWRRMMGLGPVM